nr:MAG TPA: hypothetical protein [Bacteriophage sp.]
MSPVAKFCITYPYFSLLLYDIAFTGAVSST